MLQPQCCPSASPGPLTPVRLGAQKADSPMGHRPVGGGGVEILARLHPRQPVELVLQGCRPLPCPWHSSLCSEPQCLLAEPPMTGMQNLSPGRRLWLCAAVAHIKIPKFFQEPRGVAAAPEGGMGRNLEICALPFPAGTFDSHSGPPRLLSSL